MRDIQLYIEKLHADAQDCLLISQTATTDTKRNVFSSMAETYKRLAAELEKIAAATALLDHQRDGHLFGILGGDDIGTLAEIATLGVPALKAGGSPK